MIFLSEQKEKIINMNHVETTNLTGIFNVNSLDDLT